MGGPPGMPIPAHMLDQDMIGAIKIKDGLFIGDELASTVSHFHCRWIESCKLLLFLVTSSTNMHDSKNCQPYPRMDDSTSPSIYSPTWCWTNWLLLVQFFRSRMLLNFFEGIDCIDRDSTFVTNFINVTCDCASCRTWSLWWQIKLHTLSIAQANKYRTTGNPLELPISPSSGLTKTTR